MTYCIKSFVTQRNENFWVVRIGKFFGLFHTKSFIGCRVWSSVVAILEPNWTNTLAMGFFIWYFFFVYFECRTSNFWFRFGGKYTSRCSPEWSSVFSVSIKQVFVVVLFGLFNQVIINKNDFLCHSKEFKFGNFN